jgi:predicted small lipoprotein YifL
VVLRGTVLLLCLLALAACGSAGTPAAKPKSCTSPRAAHALRKLRADTAAIRSAARLPVKDTLRGNAAVSRATDRFLRDVALAPLDNLTRNRLIDHAAAALVGSCVQCFQALEAERPIVWIAKGAHHGGCPK